MVLPRTILAHIPTNSVCPRRHRQSGRLAMSDPNEWHIACDRDGFFIEDEYGEEILPSWLNMHVNPISGATLAFLGLYLLWEDFIAPLFARRRP
jgi:hypothetical protein